MNACEVIESAHVKAIDLSLPWHISAAMVAPKGNARVCEHNEGVWVAGMFNGFVWSVYIEQDMCSAVLHTVEGMLARCT